MTEKRGLTTGSNKMATFLTPMTQKPTTKKARLEATSVVGKETTGSHFESSDDGSTASLNELGRGAVNTLFERNTLFESVVGLFTIHH